MDFLANTTLPIDLWRERRKSGFATQFAERHPDSTIHLPWIAKAEFLRGARYAKLDPMEVIHLLSSFCIQWPGEQTMEIYAQIWADLAGKGKMIGPNDLWIAASAIEKNLPLLTRNSHEFERIANLKVVDYTLPEYSN